MARTNVLNKVMKPENKTESGKDDASMAVFQNVMEKAAKVGSSVPDIRFELVANIEKAEKDLKEAEDHKETAESEAELRAAIDHVQYLREVIVMNRRKLEEFDFKMRMDEQEYDSCVKSVDDVVNSAADHFRKEAERLMTELMTARERYIEVTRKADHVLEKLDSAANVMQVRYRYKIRNLIDADPAIIEDKNEWRRHVVRYGYGKGYQLATAGEGLESCLNAAAWHAVQRLNYLMKEKHIL